MELMLTLKNQRRGISWQWFVGLFGALLLLAGLYILSLVLAPQLSTLTLRPLTADTVSAISVGQDRIIIPKIGVNIHYGTNGMTSLNEGALWRYPDRGSPTKGGNFIIAAHRFSIQPTPGGTVKASPFYHLDSLKTGDQILIDFGGKRYGYTVAKTFGVKPNAVSIEDPSKTAKLTIYTCDLGGSADGRLVIVADPMGEVTVGK